VVAVSQLPSKVTRVTGSTLLLSENYQNHFFSFARLIAVYRNAYKLDMEHDGQRVNIVRFPPPPRRRLARWAQRSGRARGPSTGDAEEE